MAVSSVNSYTSLMRLTGLGGSGLDTEAIVKQLMSAERIPLDKLYQKKQLAEWRRDDYRSITSLLKSFQDEFFDVLKPVSNMRSQSIYQKFTAESTDSSVVTATGGAGITSLSHEIIVDRIASAAQVKAGGMASKEFSGRTVGSFEVNDYNNSFEISYNGVKKIIKLPNGTYNGAEDIIGNGSDGKLKQLVEQAFSGITVTASAGGIKFTPVNSSDVVTLRSSLSSDNFLSALKVSSAGAGSAITFPLNVADGRKFTVTIVEGDVTRREEIEWADAASYDDSAALAADIQQMLDVKFGSGKITVDGTDGKLNFTKGEGVNALMLSNSSNNNRVLQNLGFDSGDSNKLSVSDTMEKAASKLMAPGDGEAIAFDEDGNFTLTINGTDITANKKDTLSSLLYKVNNSAANVTMSYSSYTDTFNIVSKATGRGSITLDDNGSGFFAATKLTEFVEGADASFYIDGKLGTRDTNNFTVDGVTYTLLSADPGVKQTVKLARDTQATYDAIKSFVDKYNELIDKINAKLGEKYDRNYQPLTNEQKESMSEDEIKKWEDKAKTGLLRNDSVLSKIVTDMRMALYSSIDGVTGGLSSIGITTGTYDQKGRLIIDEAKLKNAISNSPDQVMNIFSKESEISYSPDGDPTGNRFKENGIINRLYDILQGNIRTLRDRNGSKGSLLEKAGFIGDASEFDNVFYDEITDYDKRINELSDKLVDKENAYYARFTNMEKLIAQMNTQSSWIAAQLGQGQ
jgi:flagellar hook-associated protein 2